MLCDRFDIFRNMSIIQVLTEVDVAVVAVDEAVETAVDSQAVDAVVLEEAEEAAAEAVGDSGDAAVVPAEAAAAAGLLVDLVASKAVKKLLSSRIVMQGFS